MEAEAVYRELVETYVDSKGEENTKTILYMSYLARCLFEQDKWEESEDRYRQALTLRTKILGRDNSSTITSLNNVVMISNIQYENIYFMIINRL